MASGRALYRRAAVFSARGFASSAPGGKAGTVAGTEGLTGVARKEEAFEAAFPGAGDYFDRAGVGAFEEGTRENPIPILSTEAERCVGISLPDDSEIRWFNLKAGELAYDPDTCNFFALKRVSAARVDEWTARAEAAVEGAGAV